MFILEANFLLLLVLFHESDCQRKITGGYEVTQDKRYVVYLVKAPIASRDYKYWLCGGAIVSSQFVVTSAACVKDVDYLFVIAGYSKYIPDDEIHNDPCTKNSAKKVIYTCSPKGYELRYDELDYWSFIDIALVKTETPFDFNDDFYTQYCSYKPTIIPINYDSKYIQPGTDSMVMGWGSYVHWRKPDDLTNTNSPMLMFARTLILNKSVCMEHYDEYLNMSYVIDRYMICTLGEGNIDVDGSTVLQSSPLVNGCTRSQQKIMGFEGETCEDQGEAEPVDITDYMSDDGGRRDFNHAVQNNFTVTHNETANPSIDMVNTRRDGICQNDHGGPLITWVGSREVLIGVASVFKVSEDSSCMGPFLYTSTIKCSLFLECVLNTGELPETEKNHKTIFRRDLCERSPEEKGFETIERYISWKDHSHGHYKKQKKHHNVPREKNYAANQYTAPKYTENKKFASHHRIEPKERNTGNERHTANDRNKNIGRNLNEGFPKLDQQENNGIAMRPLRPIRN